MLRRVPHLLFCLLPFVAAAADAPVLRVAVSLLPQVEIVQRIGGTRVQVEPLQEFGDSCGVFDVRPARLAWLAGCDVYFAIGAAFEQSLLPRLTHTHPRLKIVSLTATGADPAGSDGPGGHAHSAPEPCCGHLHAVNDPHTWLDPLRVRDQAAQVGAVLSQLDPAGAESYAANTASLQADIDRLHAHLQQVLAPLHGAPFYAYHAAFGYFARRYGLRQLSVQVDGREPAPRQLRDLIAAARREGVAVLFVQPQDNRRHAEIVARAIGAELIACDPLAPDWLANLQRIGALFAAHLRPPADD
jgi:zinc transport system substrate-binding protein